MFIFAYTKTASLPQFSPSPVYLARSVCCMSVSLSVSNHFSPHPPPYIELSSPPLYAGIFILLKPLKSKHWRRDQLRPM